VRRNEVGAGALDESEAAPGRSAETWRSAMALKFALITMFALSMGTLTIAASFVG
jgi:hypothetical protein